VHVYIYGRPCFQLPTSSLESIDSPIGVKLYIPGYPQEVADMLSGDKTLGEDSNDGGNEPKGWIRKNYDT
jgi:hypothetical protein